MPSEAAVVVAAARARAASRSAPVAAVDWQALTDMF